MNFQIKEKERPLVINFNKCLKHVYKVYKCLKIFAKLFLKPYKNNIYILYLCNMNICIFNVNELLNLYKYTSVKDILS